jgi:tetratricopeptide (TPR) repeat protein
VAEKDESPRVRDGYASMKARQVVETEKWDKLALSPAPVKDGGAPGYDGSAAYVFAAGFSAAHLNDADTAKRALDMLTAMQKQAEGGSNAYRAKPIAVMAKEVASGIAHMDKNIAEAERLLKEATAIEATLDAPSGPPEPIKPSFELYGQFLLSQGRMKEAAAEFQQALLRMPNRRISRHGLEQTKITAQSQAGAK